MMHKKEEKGWTKTRQSFVRITGNNNNNLVSTQMHPKLISSYLQNHKPHSIYIYSNVMHIDDHTSFFVHFMRLILLKMHMTRVWFGVWIYGILTLHYNKSISIKEKQN